MPEARDRVFKAGTDQWKSRQEAVFTYFRNNIIVRELQVQFSVIVLTGTPMLAIATARMNSSGVDKEVIEAETLPESGIA